MGAEGHVSGGFFSGQHVQGAQGRGWRVLEAVLWKQVRGDIFHYVKGGRVLRSGLLKTNVALE